MPHHPLSFLIRKTFSDIVREDADSLSGLNAFRESRRNFLKTTIAAAGGMTLLPGFLKNESGVAKLKSADRVVIVGAGIAGLQAAYQLKKIGIRASVYEGNSRTGGRMFTMNDLFGNGLTTDFGGEFVDSTHLEILQLTKELNIDLYDLRRDQLAPKCFYFGGRRLDEADLREAIRPFVPALEKDILSLPPVISYKTADSFRRLDQLSITEYLTYVGIQGWLYDFLNVVLTREYGMEASEQSAINFLIMFAAPAEQKPDYELFGQDHEVLKIKGGSQQLTHALSQQLQEQLILGHRLTEINKRNEAYELVFENKDQRKKIIADYVILTIPFSVLRTIPINLEMDPLKRNCIDQIGYGNSCKFMIGMNTKPWRQAGKQGYSFNDLAYGCGWDSSQMQSDDLGSFTVFGGGNYEEAISGETADNLVSKIIPALDTVYPGSTAAYNGKQFKYCWSKNAWSKAGYSSFKKGQWSTLAGWEAVPVGNIFFAGEHTSREFQGYMNGAAETGRVAAEMVALKIKALQN